MTDLAPLVPSVWAPSGWRSVGPEAASDHAPLFGERAIRTLDVVLAALMVAIALPLLVTVALAVKLGDGGPVLFGHARIGANGRRFRCWKFRSMAVDAEARLKALLAEDAQARTEWELTHKLRDDPRITPLGRFIRRTSIDELPQLFNVLRGEMSLVGPRPITESEVHRYGRHFAHYCAVRPGITGLWQIKREDDTSYRRRVAFDVAYARARSLSLNVRILLLTPPRVILGRGAC